MTSQRKPELGKCDVCCISVMPQKGVLCGHCIKIFGHEKCMTAHGIGWLCAACCDVATNIKCTNGKHPAFEDDFSSDSFTCDKCLSSGLNVGCRQKKTE